MVDNRCSILGCNQFEKVNPFLLGPIFEFICLFTQFSLDFQQKSSQTIIFLFSSPENSTKNYFVIQVLRNAMAALGPRESERLETHWKRRTERERGGGGENWGLKLIETVFIHTKVKHLWNNVLCHFPLVTMPIHVRVARSAGWNINKWLYLCVYMSHGAFCLYFGAKYCLDDHWDQLKRESQKHTPQHCLWSDKHNEN